MPRVARKNLKSKYVHIMVQGIEKKYIFQSEKSKNYYLKLVFNILEQHSKLYLISYCAMDNHVHFLFYYEDIEDITCLMRKANTSYALWYNKMEGRVGYVFRNRYSIQEIKDESHLLNCLAYIHNNPVKANLVKCMQDYKFSSYNLYKNNKISNEIIKIVFGQDDFMDRFDYIHKNFDGDEIVEVDEDNATFEDIEKITQSFCEDNDVSIEFIKKNNYLLISLVDEINKNLKTTNKQICKFLKIGKNRINYISKNRKH